MPDVVSASRSFNLDNIRSQISQRHGAHGAGQDAGQIKNPYPFECSRHTRPPPSYPVAFEFSYPHGKNRPAQPRCLSLGAHSRRPE